MGTDSLYYIRDYSGNYYRINNINELVAVRNETDATVFNYDQAKSHIGTGKMIYLNKVKMQLVRLWRGGVMKNKCKMLREWLVRRL